MSGPEVAEAELDHEEAGDVRLMIGAVAAVLLLVVARPHLVSLFDAGTGREWMTVFVAVSVQAMPFLVLGVVLAGAISALVSPAALARVLPRNRAAAVVVSGGAGLILPGCECGAVPIAGRLIGGRVPAAAALTFLLAAPAINPVVLVATATAFPGQPELVAASLDDYLKRHPEMIGPGTESVFLTTGDPVAVGHKATQFLRRRIPFRAA